MENRQLKFLECLCVKDVGKGVMPSRSTLSGKLSCNAAQVKAKPAAKFSITSIKSTTSESVDTDFPNETPESNNGPIYEVYFFKTTLERYNLTVNIGDTAVTYFENNIYRYTVHDVEYLELGRSFRVYLKFLESSSGLDNSRVFNNIEGDPLSFNFESKTTVKPLISRVAGIKGKIQNIGTLLSQRGESVNRLPLRGQLTLLEDPITIVDLKTSHLSANVPLEALAKGSGNLGEIKNGLTATYSVRQKVESEGKLNPTALEKLRGDFGDFKCVQKLYPVADVDIDVNMGKFTGPMTYHSEDPSGLYSFIDEGVVIGDHDKPFSTSTIIADDHNTFIQPSTFHTDGTFQYKCELSNFSVRPDHSRLRIRTSAPLANYEALVAPKYTIYEAKLVDPSGNTIIKYVDHIFKGDADQEGKPKQNYMTISLEPEINNVADLYDWQRVDSDGNRDLFLDEGQRNAFDSAYDESMEIANYQLWFNVKVEALDDAFDTGFDKGFEENHIDFQTGSDSDDYLALDGQAFSTQDASRINPTKNIRISAIEICNSGFSPFGQGMGPRPENYLSFYLEVPTTGRRIERRITPSLFPIATYDNGVWPGGSSIWTSNINPEQNNEDKCGAEHLLKDITDDQTYSYATITSMGPHEDSGKLSLKFSHGGWPMQEVRHGAFNCSFDQTTCPTWFEPSGAFNTQDKFPLVGDRNGFFAVESVTLKIVAKKAVGTRDFALDVVGYSDDKILNVTTAPSGFLQNPSGVQINNIILGSEGVHPFSSGFLVNSDDLGMSTESLSEKENYYAASGNKGGDHYAISRYPIVNTTEFKEYEVPLKIYDDDVKLGNSRDYSMSSMFEHLYLDIYPIPTGASVADVHLLVRFKPQDAFMLSVQGGEKVRKAQPRRSETKIFPTQRLSVNDQMLNTGSGFQPLSKIEDIPHGYATPSSIKTNYSRRWRGKEGTVQGPYDPDVFSFGFVNPLLDYPFLSGYYKFNNVQGLNLNSEPLGDGYGNAVGTFSQTPEIYQNVGWRFTTDSIFASKGMTVASDYTTSDWTIDKPAHALHGKIADAFDNVVRISGFNQNINFGNIDTASGFSIFARFSPDIDYKVDGGVDTFSSGVIFSKWTNANDLDFALGFEAGHLVGFAKDDQGNLITIRDSLHYRQYQYPLSVLLTYNDHNQSGLKLYTDNEGHRSTYTAAYEDSLESTHPYLRASSVPFHKNRTNQNFVVGWSEGSGVGTNMLLSELGISTYESGVDSGASVIFPYGSGTNIVTSHADKTHKQVSAETVFDNIRAKFFDPGDFWNTDSYKLWDYVNEDTDDWDLGEFKVKQFNRAFRRWTKRSGPDLITFNIKHHGSGYSQYADIHPMPVTVDSGVAYHTQIENDFLRFHLSDTADNFYSVHKRVSKSLPAGYKFSENALVVETVIEHTTDNDIAWPFCQPTAFPVCTEHRHYYDEELYGAKLIVSLYTKKQEPTWTNNETNWGLINRAIHYIEPSSDVTRLDSKFTYDSLADESEKWALFPQGTRQKDFKERLFSEDVDDMFVQYDLVYPSGPPFESRIDIHTTTVRMGDAYVKATDTEGNMNIFASGGNVLNQDIPVFVSGAQLGAGGTVFQSGFPFNFYLDGPKLVAPPVESGMKLSVSGAFQNEQHMNLFSIQSKDLDSSWNPPGMYLTISGSPYNPIGESGSLNLAIPKVVGIANNGNGLPLTLVNTSSSSPVDGDKVVTLFTYAVSGWYESGTLGLRGLPFGLNVSGVGPKKVSNPSGSLNLNVFGFDVPENRFPSVDMSLFIDTPPVVTTTVPLYTTAGDGITPGTKIGEGTLQIPTMNLFMSNYGGRGSDYLAWTNRNYGRSIAQADNVYAKVPVGNEIRGVDLIGYGACDGDSPSKAIDPAIITDDTEWRKEACEEGGIFRAKATYTNMVTSGFGDTVGYSGNYYGIRKFTGLTPGGAYDSVMKIRTGHTQPIRVARNLEDWEYGHCGPEHFVDAGGSSGCCDSDCTQSLVHSGNKLIGDYPLISNSRDLTPASGRGIGHNYGQAVSVIKDLMVVGSPHASIPVINQSTMKESGIDDAGAVFLYRRGADVAGKKAAWDMEDKIMLPSGFRKDYIQFTRQNFIQYDQWGISGQQWAIGQEGRRFGSSLDICSSGDRETLVVGAPYASWSRTFDDINTSGIPVAMMVFTDTFNYSKKEVEKIAFNARKWDILYKYFSAPWFAGTDYEFQPLLDINLFVFELARSEDDKPPVKHDHPWFTHNYMDRMDDKDLTDQDGFQAVYDNMLSGVKDAFLSKFSQRVGPHSGIAPILGVFREKSNSAGLGAFLNPLDMNNVVDDFLEFYEDYTYTSGVIDPPLTTSESGYFNKILAPSESWHQASIDLLNKTLDSGNLIKQDALKFITSGVGQEWSQPNAYEFQIPPSSGGRVFIFENESDKFNCVQEIKSFNDRESSQFNIGEGTDGDTPSDDYFGYGSFYNDRYGHAVSISKNSEVISIGSPFTTNACEIYQRDDSVTEKVNNKVLEYLNSIGDTSAVTRYNSLLADSGVDVAQRVSYHEMSQDDKLRLRQKYDFNLYKPIFNYGYGDIKSTGTWQFIPNKFLRSSRLGYSTAVSDNGDTVAFGAPTDSTTMFEDTNVWYKGKETFASHTNAGAVRIFEAKKIYPHSGVVEFTRFGNLDRAMHQTEREAGIYDQMGLYFKPSNLPFKRTNFETIEIPQDAGLAFIITPELDAASDEIIDNIKSWLALGDRTLVLVGNDPVYEENGLYQHSNEIVNKILEKLGSRMRIHPAESKQLSLPDCVSKQDVFNDRYNITKAHWPTYSHTRFKASNIAKPNMFARGVGDIKIDLSKENLQELMVHAPCDDVVTKNGTNLEVCKLPIKHNGDLRAEWESACMKTVGDRKIKVEFQTNWGFHFSNPNPAQGCDDYPHSPKPYLEGRPYQDPSPILTTAEFLPDEIIVIPAASGKECEQIPCFKTKTIKKLIPYKEFVDNNEDFISFNVAEDSNSEVDGIFNEWDQGTFFDPPAKNGRDGLLQSIGSPYQGKPKRRRNQILPDSILALEETYKKLNSDGTETPTSSKAIIMASLLGENKRSFGLSGDKERPSRNFDQNVLFYVNMLTENCFASSKVLQLGGWTKRTSFKDAYATTAEEQKDNILKSRLESFGIQVEENVVFADGSSIPDSDPTTGNEVLAVWIANPLGKPEDQDLNRLNTFLQREGKRVIITYSATTSENDAQKIAENVDYICEKLNLKSRPLFLKEEGEYFVQSGASVEEGNKQDLPYDDNIEATQILNPDTLPTKGCRDGYDWYLPHSLEPVDTKVEKLALWAEDYSNQGGMKEDFIPVSGGGDFKRIISYNDPIFETIITHKELYKIDAVGTVTVPAVKGSGYRLFTNWVSETDLEHYRINLYVGPVSFDPDSPEGEEGRDGWIEMTHTAARNPATSHIDFMAKSDELTIKVEAKHNPIDPIREKELGRPIPPMTTRWLSMSGCPLPIVTKVRERTVTKKIPCDPPFTEKCTYWYREEQTIVIPGEFRPVSHPSDPYCCCPECPPRNTAEIEDGPVVAAEEFENFSDGRNGNERSKIVVLADSTMIQGQCPDFRSDALGENQFFIRSLYPTSASFGDGDDSYAGTDAREADLLGGRRFTFTQKLRSPERGSPSKYYGVTGISNMISPLFAGGGLAGNLDKYVDNEDSYNPESPGFTREKEPIGGEIGKEIKKFINTIVPSYGLAYPGFSGDFFGYGSYKLEDESKPRDFLADADRMGGLPDLMKYNGTDYLDFESYNSGCLGDLFGYSLDMTEDKLIVGSPFNAYMTNTAISGVSGVVAWHEIQNGPQGSGIELCENGGAGAAFYFERTGRGTNVRDEFLDWEWKQKLKPSSIAVGLSNATITELFYRGPHSLDANFVHDHGRKPDRFGQSVAIDADMIAVGAPNHDFERLSDHSIYHSGQFIRKAFNSEFIIPHHVHAPYDLGDSGVRIQQFNQASGDMVLNNGAVFTFKHELVDYSNREKQWNYKQKLFAEGFKDRTKANKSIDELASGCENDNFGYSVAINRAKRGDSDYTLVVGAPYHDFATSGNHPVSDGSMFVTGGSGIAASESGNGLKDAGAAYTFDGMLRDQTPAIPNSGGWIDAEIFGDKAASGVKLYVQQPTAGSSETFEVSGVIFANEYGNIFLEASGFDPSSRGFVAHRPYVESVIGKLLIGDPTKGSMNLVTYGKPNSVDNAWPAINPPYDTNGEAKLERPFGYGFDPSMDSLNLRPSGMSLTIIGPDKANVYNNMGMSIEGILGSVSGIGGEFPSGFMLIASASGTPVSGIDANSPSGFMLNIGSEFPQQQLNINIRGR